MGEASYLAYPVLPEWGIDIDKLVEAASVGIAEVPNGSEDQFSVVATVLEHVATAMERLGIVHDLLDNLRLLQKVNEMGAGIVTFRTWTERKRIIIHFETYYPPHYDKIIGENAPADAKSTESPLLGAIARETERWIAEHPDQWSWNYHGNFLNLSPRL